MGVAGRRGVGLTLRIGGGAEKGRLVWNSDGGGRGPGRLVKSEEFVPPLAAWCRAGGESERENGINPSQERSELKKRKGEKKKPQTGYTSRREKSIPESQFEGNFARLNSDWRRLSGKRRKNWNGGVQLPWRGEKVGGFVLGLNGFT